MGHGQANFLDLDMSLQRIMALKGATIRVLFCGTHKQSPKRFCVLLDLKRPRNRREHSIDSMVTIDVHVGGFPG